jgi:hypothetical protein
MFVPASHATHALRVSADRRQADGECESHNCRCAAFHVRTANPRPTAARSIRNKTTDRPKCGSSDLSPADPRRRDRTAGVVAATTSPFSQRGRLARARFRVDLLKLPIVCAIHLVYCHARLDRAPDHVFRSAAARKRHDQIGFALVEHPLIAQWRR